jgi:hypothetical protein
MNAQLSDHIATLVMHREGRGRKVTDALDVARVDALDAVLSLVLEEGDQVAERVSGIKGTLAVLRKAAPVAVATDGQSARTVGR